MVGGGGEDRGEGGTALGEVQAGDLGARKRAAS